MVSGDGGIPRLLSFVAASAPRRARLEDLIASSILTKYSGSMKITTHLDHISHCKIILVIDWYKLVE